MVKKLQKNNATKVSNVTLSESVKDSAQLIWQAGLGAFSRAQAEGTKAFEALVKEGINLQRKTQSAAEEKLSEATHKMTDMASGISSKATGQWDKLESIFEERVAKALNKLGVPSSQDINALIERIEALNQSVQKLSAGGAEARPMTKTAAKTAAKVPTKAVRKSVATAKPAEIDVAEAKPAAKRVRARKAAPSEATAEPSPTV